MCVQHTGGRIGYGAVGRDEQAVKRGRRGNAVWLDVHRSRIKRLLVRQQLKAQRPSPISDMPSRRVLVTLIGLPTGLLSPAPPPATGSDRCPPPMDARD
ncbi:hypothetical protein GQ53DRAFT_292783 [Thozetella sp. PMI_491]|nr:hypothetical protein GQ53DRAFT_292783 [Thozetella sp. PMI_491]